MTINQFSVTWPSSSDPDNFDARTDTIGEEFPVIIAQMNAAIALMNLNSLESTSTTSLLIGTDAKSLTAQTGKSYFVGMWVILASAANVSNFMIGQVSSYDTGTGALGVTVHFKNGTGTYADWRISIAAARNLEVIDDEIVLNTGNGVGSTNTLVTRFQTVAVNNGTSMTYVDSATLGGSITINEAGIYAFTGQHVAGLAVAITRNLTTFIMGSSVVDANTLTTGIASSSEANAVTAVVKCNPTDIIRLVLNTTTGSLSNRVFLRAKRIL